MQTFLPYARFALSARVLDRQRLGKQRVECLQILRTLCGESDGWRNHPAVRMWAGYEAWLGHYAFRIICEWTDRGYRDTCWAKILDLMPTGVLPLLSSAPRPPWLGNRRFHESHRSNLLRKFPEHYRRFWPRLRDDLPYVWPVPAEKED